jgi:hypothetical protein
MSKSKQVQAPAQPVVAAAVAQAYALTAEVLASVKVEAVNLSTADRSFEDAVKAAATNVARIMGTEPSFDHWEAVAAAFRTDYQSARGCTEETARKRWVAVCGVIESSFALVKPAKPTVAGIVKQKQREGAAAEAATLIEQAKATTPAAIIALTQQAGLKPPVVAALGKMAGEVAKEAGKAANEAAREEAKALRDEVRASIPALSLDNLRKVRDMVAALVQSQTPKAAEPAEAPAA